MVQDVHEFMDLPAPFVASSCNSSLLEGAIDLLVKVDVFVATKAARLRDRVPEMTTGDCQKL